MSGSREVEFEARLGDSVVSVPDGWNLDWVDPRQGIVRLRDAGSAVIALVEGAGTEWVVTLRGRRIPITVRSRRERILAEAADAGGGHAGPIELKASLPGLVVAVRAAVGSEVAEGESLLTIEAMKMQNEVRAPRAGRVAGISVAPGETVRSGQPLLNIE